ncbi:hypothetical protein MKP09_17025 [Niabella ginsengisoli]|uniref:Cytidine deaminase n=1 Tax=Niabella ginsengisoli TaxID=522298 RepID=A0ABS9SJ79_9BACT|nr:hypothetical protein [Niabella ginsengisoli]MCH5598426.1 hypothetical protein [Niabella ginsengisoli]MCH5599483.1 hypothetical protein [Niabella ginsengisoli]
MASVGTLYPNEVIETMAITYQPQEALEGLEGLEGLSDKPISPCGMCRQALLEYETRVNHPIRLILAGMKGTVYIIDTAKDLLPFAFGEVNLK